MLSTNTKRLIKEEQSLRQRVNELEKSQIEYEHMEKALKDSEEKYRTVPIGVFLYFPRPLKWGSLSLKQTER